MTALNMGGDGNGYLQLLDMARGLVAVTAELDSVFLSNTEDDTDPGAKYLSSRSTMWGTEQRQFQILQPVDGVVPGVKGAWELRLAEGYSTLEAGAKVFLIGSGNAPYLTTDASGTVHAPVWASVTELGEDPTRGQWIVETQEHETDDSDISQTTAVYFKAVSADPSADPRYMHINWGASSAKSLMIWKTNRAEVAPCYIHRRKIAENVDGWLKRYAVNLSFLGLPDASDGCTDCYTDMGSHRLLQSEHGLTLYWYSSVLNFVWKYQLPSPSFPDLDTRVAALEGTWVPYQMSSWSVLDGHSALDQRNALSFGTHGNGELKFSKAMGMALGRQCFIQ
jgi:hypothetical protein